MKYGKIKVQLTGRDGNAFSILGNVVSELRRGLRSKYNMNSDTIAAEIKSFQTEAMSGDYDNLLCTCMKWVDVR